jgi:hypothetical protein
MTLPFHSPLYDFGVAGPEETKNLAGKALRLIQIRLAIPSLEKTSDVDKAISLARTVQDCPSLGRTCFSR